MYVAEMTVKPSWGEAYTTRIEDTRGDIFYAKVAGAVAGVTMSNCAVVSLTMTNEGE